MPPNWIIAADEVGRGCFAGDVFVVAALIPAGLPKIPGVRDSKKLSPAQRQSLSLVLLKDPQIRHSMSRRGAGDIDQHGIEKSTTACFLQAVTELIALIPPWDTALIKIDGAPIWSRDKFPYPTEFIVKGDDLEWEIGAASILAKVARDAYMDDLSIEHPVYDWAKNKGYGTADHIRAIQKHGLTEHHRKTFCKNCRTTEQEDVLSMFGG